NRVKIFISDFYAIYKNEVYCALILKDELLGFVNIRNTSFFINFKKDFKFTTDKVILFKDSKLEKVLTENFHHKDETYIALGGFEKFEGVRVIVDGKR